MANQNPQRIHESKNHINLNLDEKFYQDNPKCSQPFKVQQMNRILAFLFIENKLETFSFQSFRNDLEKSLKIYDSPILNKIQNLCKIDYKISGEDISNKGDEEFYQILKDLIEEKKQMIYSLYCNSYSGDVDIFECLIPMIINSLETHFKYNALLINAQSSQKKIANPNELKIALELFRNPMTEKSELSNLQGCIISQYFNLNFDQYIIDGDAVRRQRFRFINKSVKEQQVPDFCLLINNKDQTIQICGQSQEFRIKACIEDKKTFYSQSTQNKKLTTNNKIRPTQQGSNKIEQQQEQPVLPKVLSVEKLEGKQVEKKLGTSSDKNPKIKNNSTPKQVIPTLNEEQENAPKEYADVPKQHQDDLDQIPKNTVKQNTDIENQSIYDRSTDFRIEESQQIDNINHQQEDKIEEMKKVNQQDVCPTCLEIIDSSWILNCKHKIHLSCLVSTVNGQYDSEKRLLSEFLCPIDGCKSQISGVLIKNLLENDKYEEIVATTRAQKVDKSYRCPWENCKTIIIGFKTEIGINDKQLLICISCKQQICILCRQKYHGENLFDEVNNGKVKDGQQQYVEKTRQECPMVLDLIREGLGNQQTFLCPKCNIIALKDESCDQVTCANCKLVCCFPCSVAQNPISVHGNHYHRNGCKNFMEWIDENTGQKGVDLYSDKCQECLKIKKICERPLNLEQYKLKNPQWFKEQIQKEIVPQEIVP